MRTAATIRVSWADLCHLSQGLRVCDFLTGTLLARPGQAPGRGRKWGRPPGAGRARLCCCEDGRCTVCTPRGVGCLALAGWEGEGPSPRQLDRGACGPRRCSQARPP